MTIAMRVLEAHVKGGQPVDLPEGSEVRWLS
jgi:hypothetical protein